MRLLASACAGLTIAVVLFLLMSQLIAGGEEAPSRTDVALNLDFIRLNLDEIENIRRRAVPPPPDPVEPPEAPPMVFELRPQTELESFAEIDTSAFSADAMELPTGIGMGRFTGGIRLADLSEDGDLYPILQVTPIYPASARLNRMFGWVDIQYTVLADGTVVDPLVIASHVERPGQSAATVRTGRPRQDIFNQATIDAALRTRFKPRVIDGQAVPVRVTQRYTFNVID